MSKLTATEARLAAAIRSQGYPITDQQVHEVTLQCKVEKQPTELQKMTSAMLEVSRWSDSKFPRALKSAQAMLKEGKTAEEVIIHYGFKDPGAGQWWWRRKGVDFRNRNNADPTPEIIVETCKKWTASPMQAPAPSHAQPLQYKL